MEVSRFIQADVSSSTGAGFYAAVPTAEDTGDQVKGDIAPELDSLTITSTNTVVARRNLTQQIEIALEIKTPVPVYMYSGNDSEASSNDTFSQGLANKAVQKMVLSS